MMISGCANNGASVLSTAQTSLTEKPPADTTAAADEASDEEKEKAAALAYLEDLKVPFHKYVEACSTYTDDLEAARFEDAGKDLDDMENALSDLVNVEAPEKYSASHSRLRGSLSSEYDYIRLNRKFLDYCEKGDDLTEDDRIELKGLTHELELTPSDFSEEFMILVKTVKADIEE